MADDSGLDGADVAEPPPECGTLHAPAGEPAIVVVVRQDDPAFGLLACDERLGALTLIEDAFFDDDGWDLEYSIDDLNRVIQAERGEWGGSSITTTHEDEVWTLDQVGNWDIHQLDLNGDGDFTDADELDDDGTFNAVNELTARDTDDDGNDDYTLVYDAVGNLTDDDENYEYIYDAFGRLVEITDQSQDTVTEYAYNGLGYRISVHYDTDIDGDVDANDATYHHVYDTHWQVVGTYRNDDDDPKEQFTHHSAGVSSGQGGSSYIDMIICRDKDANTDWDAEADGTLEKRTYYFQNYHGDVVALLTDSGALEERVFYSPYGVPFASRVGDADADGDVDQSDLGIVLAALSGPYNARCDFDLDGDVDQSDLGIHLATSGSSLGRGVLSSDDVQNFFGYAGYRHDEAIDVICHVRYRVYLAELGRWTRRDPLGYVDGMNLYEYACDSPLVNYDPFGLMCGPGMWCYYGLAPAPGPKIPGCPTRQPSGPGLLYRLDGWCSEGKSKFHCNNRCYRSYGSGTTSVGQQCCYSPNGKLDTRPGCAGTIDGKKVPFGEYFTGRCMWGLTVAHAGRRILAHYIEDVSPYKRDPKRYEEVQCCIREFAPSGTPGSGITEREYHQIKRYCERQVTLGGTFCKTPPILPPRPARPLERWPGEREGRPRPGSPGRMW
ncbi:MAG: hypothetical protein KAS72_11035 [Phycisphaerales bacterium]|nr:hypothetical protein [Phycisphaerales bacterium]